MNRETARPCTGDRATILLWGFDVTLQDRRTGKEIVGNAVEIGNKAYDIDDAIEKIAQKYSLLGYELVKAEFKAQKSWELDAVGLYSELPEDKGSTPADNIAGLDELASAREMPAAGRGITEEQLAAAMHELEGV